MGKQKRNGGHGKLQKKLRNVRNGKSKSECNKSVGRKKRRGAKKWPKRRLNNSLATKIVGGKRNRRKMNYHRNMTMIQQYRIRITMTRNVNLKLIWKAMMTWTI